MKTRLTFLAGILTGILLVALYCKRSKRETAQSVDDNAKWDKRINEMNSIYAEEKANSRLGKR